MMEWMTDVIGNLEFPVELAAAQFLFVRTLPHREKFQGKAVLTILLLAAFSLLFRYDVATTVLPPLGLLLRYGVILAASTAGFFLCFRSSWRTILLYAVCGYTVQHFGFSAHELVKMGVNRLFPEISSILLAHILALLVVYSFCYWLMDHWFIKTIVQVGDVPGTGRAALLQGGILVIAITINFFVFQLDEEQAVVCRLLVAFTCLLGMASTAELFHGRKLEMDLAFARQQAENKADYYTLLKDSIDATNLRCHDIKHQLAGLRIQAGGGNGMARLPEQSIQELENSINIYDGIAKTGNAALDTVLTEKSLVCQKEGIRLVYMADGKALELMEERDLYALFGNILDNAIEAVQKLQQPTQKVVHLSAIQAGPFVHIHLYNYFEGELVMENGLPRTTKPDKFLHGYGMKSVQLIVDQYHGQLQISAQKHIFSLDITIPVVTK